MVLGDVMVFGVLLLLKILDNIGIICRSLISLLLFN